MHNFSKFPLKYASHTHVCNIYEAHTCRHNYMRNKPWNKTQLGIAESAQICSEMRSQEQKYPSVYVHLHEKTNSRTQCKKLIKDFAENRQKWQNCWKMRSNMRRCANCMIIFTHMCVWKHHYLYVRKYARCRVHKVCDICCYHTFRHNWYPTLAVHPM